MPFARVVTSALLMAPVGATTVQLGAPTYQPGHSLNHVDELVLFAVPMVQRRPRAGRQLRQIHAEHDQPEHVAERPPVPSSEARGKVCVLGDVDCDGTVSVGHGGVSRLVGTAIDRSRWRGRKSVASQAAVAAIFAPLFISIPNTHPYV